MLGWRLTKSPIAPANTSITPTAMTIATTITDDVLRHARPR